MVRGAQLTAESLRSWLLKSSRTLVTLPRGLAQAFGLVQRLWIVGAHLRIIGIVGKKDNGAMMSAHLGCTRSGVAWASLLFSSRALTAPTVYPTETTIHVPTRSWGG